MRCARRGCFGAKLSRFSASKKSTKGLLSLLLCVNDCDLAPATQHTRVTLVTKRVKLPIIAGSCAAPAAERAHGSAAERTRKRAGAGDVIPCVCDVEDTDTGLEKEQRSRCGARSEKASCMHAYRKRGQLPCQPLKS